MEESFAPKRSLIRRMFPKRVIITMITTIALATASYFWFIHTSLPVPQEFNFQVEKTDTVHTIARNLLSEKIIKHRAFFYFNYYVFGRQVPIEPAGYKLSNTMSSRSIVYTLESKPATKYIRLPSRLSKEEIGAILADELNWTTLDRQFFSNTYAGMQWQQYHEYIQEFFQKKYSWDEGKTHTFLTLSALYYNNDYDFLNNLYLPDAYEIPVGASRAQVAGILIEKFIEENPDNRIALVRFINQASADSVAKLIEQQMVLMPDIVAIPPQDVTLKKVGDQTHLLFTTSYWNKGRGPLELIADPKTKDLAGDHDRKILQRIYSLDGNYTERVSGEFLWHATHRHYHFQDFAVYSLEPLMAGASITKDKQSQKSTFCVRDSEPIDLAHPGATKSTSYTICGRERQGISPGWADSYYYTYIDQKFNVTGLPSGEYRLKIIINPLDRFDEITTENNIGEVVLNLNMETNEVEVVSEKNYGL